MAISTNAELQTAIGNWLGRTDLSSIIPDFITLAEAKIKRRVRRGTTRAALTLNAGNVALPAAAAELRSIRLNTSTASYNKPIKIVSPEELAQHRAAFSSNGRPRFASVVDGELLLVPTPDQSYTSEIIYFDALTPLSGGGATNSVLTEAPDIYLYGALLEATPYLEHDERIPVWQTKFDAAIDELNLAREREEYAASLRPARLPVVFG